MSAILNIVNVNNEMMQTLQRFVTSFLLQNGNGRNLQETRETVSR